MLRNLPGQRWRILIIAFIGITFIGCKKTQPAGQSIAQSPPASAPSAPDSPKDVDDAKTQGNSVDPEHRLKPTYDLLAALRGRPFKLVASAFDVGLSDAEIDEIVSKPDQQVVAVASADGKLVLTVEGGNLVDVELTTGDPGAASRPDDEP